MARAIIPTTAAAAPVRVAIAVSKPKQSSGSAGTKSKTAKPRVRAPKGMSKSKAESKAEKKAEKKSQRANMDLTAAPLFGAAELFIDDDDALSLVSSVTAGGLARTPHTSTAVKAPTKERKRKRSEAKGAAVVPKAKREFPKIKPDLSAAEKPAASRKPGTVQLRFQEEFNNLMWGRPRMPWSCSPTYTDCIVTIQRNPACTRLCLHRFD